MRKVMAVLMSLILSALLVSCSDDDTTTVTPPPAPQLGITTVAAMTAHTCAPVSYVLEVENGTAPYAWDIAAGSSLPTGVSMTAEGVITGIVDAEGEHSFTIECTDSSNPPKTASREFTLTVSQVSNPSLALYFDQEATDCSCTTAAWSNVNCYAFIMLDPLADELSCARACEFKLRLTDVDDTDLEAGTHYIITNVDFPDNTITMGDLFSGIAISFSRPMFAPDPIQVARFDLILIEDLNNISFKFEPNPGGFLGVAICDANMSVINAGGRAAAVNY